MTHTLIAAASATRRAGAYDTSPIVADHKGVVVGAPPRPAVARQLVEQRRSPAPRAACAATTGHAASIARVALRASYRRSSAAAAAPSAGAAEPSTSDRSRAAARSASPARS